MNAQIHQQTMSSSEAHVNGQRRLVVVRTIVADVVFHVYYVHGYYYKSICSPSLV